MCYVTQRAISDSSAANFRTRSHKPASAMCATARRTKPFTPTASPERTHDTFKIAHSTPTRSAEIQHWITNAAPNPAKP
ncbi:unnamed protein product, partial [Iphiclides podalirius]